MTKPNHHDITNKQNHPHKEKFVKICLKNNQFSFLLLTVDQNKSINEAEILSF